MNDTITSRTDTGIGTITIGMTVTMIDTTRPDILTGMTGVGTTTSTLYGTDTPIAPLQLEDSNTRTTMTGTFEPRKPCFKFLNDLFYHRPVKAAAEKGLSNSVLPSWRLIKCVLLLKNKTLSFRFHKLQVK